MNRLILTFRTTLLLSLLATAPVHADLDNDEQLLMAARNGNLAQLQTLLDHGANPNAINSRGFTPLILAAYHGHVELMEQLIQSGAQPCAIDHKGSNAMMGAAFRGQLHVIQWLLKNSPCGVNHRNHAGQTALMMAALFGREEIVDLLLQHNADANIADAMGNRAATLAAAQGQQALAEKLR